MPALKLDTLAIAKELEESGIPIKQAEAQTRIYAKVINMMVEEQLVTKQDLAEVERGLSKKMDAIDNRFSKLETEIQTQILKITIRLGSILVTGIFVLAALIKL